MQNLQCRHAQMHGILHVTISDAFPRPGFAMEMMIASTTLTKNRTAQVRYETTGIYVTEYSISTLQVISTCLMACNIDIDSYEKYSQNHFNLLESFHESDAWIILENYFVVLRGGKTPSWSKHFLWSFIYSMLFH